MSLFVFFIFAAVLLGAGAMLSPAWRTEQPRVALAATLCLGLVTGGAVFYAETFGWDTLVVDYLLFALLSGVVLGGALSTAQARAEARGERLDDRDQGWPGPGDLCFFAFVALFVLIPLFHLPAALGEQGQVIGLHSLAARDGGAFNSLMPYVEGEAPLVSPGFHALSAYLSSQLEQPLPLIQLSVAAVVTLLIIWLAYDFGAECLDKGLGRALAAATMLGLGIYRGALDGHFAELLALLFMLAFFLYALRLLRHFNLADALAAGLMLGAVAYTSLTVTLLAGLGWVALLALVWARGRGQSTRASRLALSLGAPLIGLLGIAPWLVNNHMLMLPIHPSPAPAELGTLPQIIGEQGIVIALLALRGLWVARGAAAQTRCVSLFVLIWLLLIIDLCAIGISGRLLPPLAELTNAPNLARHGLMLPLAWFGGLALHEFWVGRLSRALKTRLCRATFLIVFAAAALLILVAIAFQALQDMLALPEARVTHADVAAMTWLAEHAPADAIVVAADGNAWLPILAERQSPNFRAHRYFEWDAVTGASDSAAPDYVYVSAAADPPSADHAELVFAQGKARIYQLFKRK